MQIKESHLVFRHELEGEPLTAEGLAKRAGKEEHWKEAAAIRAQARKALGGRKIADEQQGPFPLLCRSSGRAEELPDGHRVAIVRTKAGHSGRGRPLGDEGWLFQLVKPLVDPAIIDPLVKTEQLFVAAGFTELQFRAWRVLTLPLLRNKKAIAGWRREVLEGPDAECALAEAWLKEQPAKLSQRAATAPAPELLTRAQVPQRIP